MCQGEEGVSGRGNKQTTQQHWKEKMEKGIKGKRTERRRD